MKKRRKPDEIFHGKDYGMKPLKDQHYLELMKKQYRDKFIAFAIQLQDDKLLHHIPSELDMYRLRATIDYIDEQNESIVEMRELCKEKIKEFVRAKDVENNLELLTYVMNLLCTYETVREIFNTKFVHSIGMVVYLNTMTGEEMKMKVMTLDVFKKFIKDHFNSGKSFPTILDFDADLAQNN